MQVYLSVLALGLSLLAAPAQDPAPKINLTPPNGGYYLRQHPEWPPLLGPVGSNLPTYRLSQTNLLATTNYLVDDREVHYPQQRTNAKPIVSELTEAEMARHPELVAAAVARVQRNQEAIKQGHYVSMDQLEFDAERAARIVALSRTAVPSVTTLEEDLQIEQYLILGAIAKTNRQALLKGVEGTFASGGGFFVQCDPRHVERAYPLALRAKAATNRGDVLPFLNSLKPKPSAN